ncbi:hypothetical protein EGW08_007730 [Elysia chlorotica]|uniref:Glutathione transferase n=1 Tax=Elysia chlorotica TaxID=188477 RepID=A0A3S1BBM3_ELYCH|nr:hypothetical protein EGW08_007730 [Elysia chlorotica]
MFRCVPAQQPYSIMPSYKLTYFDLRGRAEVSRLIFAYAKQEFEDKRIQFPDWPALKPNTPFGQLPILEVDGQVIGQSTAINNFLAREFGLYGKTNMESCQVDQIGCLLEDYFQLAIKAMFEKDEAKKAQLMKELKEETAPKYLDLLEKLLKKNGSGYFVGKEITLADINVYNVTWAFLNEAPAALDSFPLLKEFHHKVNSIPQIKSYVDARKPSDR